MYTNKVFGTAKYVLFIEVSLFQGVLIKRFHCTWCYTPSVILTCTHGTILCGAQQYKCRDLMMILQYHNMYTI